MTGGRAGIGTQAAGVGKPGAIVTGLGQDAGGCYLAEAGEAGQDRRVGMLGEGVFGRLGQLLDGAAGGVKLHQQRAGLFAERGLHLRQLAQLLGWGRECASGQQLFHVVIGLSP